MGSVGLEMKPAGVSPKGAHTSKVNYTAVIITGLAAFALSLLWYSPILFGTIWMQYRTGPQVPPDWTFALAPLRELTACYVIALLLSRLGIFQTMKAAAWMLLLWFAFHAVGMTGAVLWDNMPWQLGAIHAGDWLMKMLFMATALTLWPGKKEAA